MKKLISYMVCIVGLVLVLCGSASAYDITVGGRGNSNFIASSVSSGSYTHVTDSTYIWSYGVSYCTGVYLVIPPSEVPCYFTYSGISLYKLANGSGTSWTSSTTSSDPSAKQIAPLFLYTSNLSGNPLVLDSYATSPSAQSLILPPHSSNLYVFIFGYVNNARVGVRIFPNASFFLTPCANAQDSTVQSLIPILERIASNTSSGSPSLMEQFENDYLGNEHISGQLDKAEQFISPSNPGLPNGGDVGGFAEQIQQGMGFNGSSFDSEKFQQATDAFKVDSTSTGEGGMWWFFSQDVADSLAHDDASTVSDDDGQSLQDAWVEQIKRRWGNW